MQWNRIGDDTICPICGRHGWDLVSDDNKYICCQRVKSPIKLGEAGYIHTYQGKLNVRPQHTRYDPDYWKKVWAKGTVDIPNYLSWGVSLDSLRRFEVKWHTAKRCYLFPMCNGFREVIGLQEHYLTGEKKATAGSKLGLFMPDIDFKTTKFLIITEGKSDAVVLYEDTHLPIIARPTCSTGNSHIKDFLNRHLNIKNVIIIADNDEVGLLGAQNLRDCLTDDIEYLNVLVPFRGSKDVRAMRGNNPGYYKNFLELLKPICNS